MNVDASPTILFTIPFFQYQTEVRNVLENPPTAKTVAARCVGQPARLPKRRLKKDTTTDTPNFYKQL